MSVSITSREAAASGFFDKARSRGLVTLGVATLFLLGRDLAFLPIDVSSVPLELRLLSIRGPFALGLASLIIAFVAIDLAVMRLPGGGTLRTGRMFGVGVGGATVLAAVVAGFVVAHLETAGATSGSWRVRLLIIVTWTAATALLGVMAEAVTRFGLGNGYAVLIAAGMIPDMARFGQRAKALDSDQAVLVLVVLASVVAASGLVLRAHERDQQRGLTPIRLPITGIVPLDLLALVFALPPALHTLAFPMPFGHLLPMIPGWGGALLVTSVVSLAGVIAALIFFPSRRHAELWRGMGEVLGLERQSKLALTRSILYLCALVFAGAFMATAQGVAGAPTVYATVLLTAVGLDLLREWKAHLADPSLVRAGVVRQIWAVEVTLERLRRADIVAVATGGFFRAALPLFGAFAPVEIWVQKPCLDVARHLLREHQRNASAINPRAPPGPRSFAIVAIKWIRSRKATLTLSQHE